MIVERYTSQVKPGKFDDAVNLIKEGTKNIWTSFSVRIYSPNYGPQNTIVTDFDFEDMAEHDKLWEEVSAKEEFTSWVARWNDEVSAGPGTHTLWTLE